MHFSLLPCVQRAPLISYSDLIILTIFGEVHIHHVNCTLGTENVFLFYEFLPLRFSVKEDLIH
jgi:hypothetical protein